jgi:hypothetical protein
MITPGSLVTFALTSVSAAARRRACMTINPGMIRDGNPMVGYFHAGDVALVVATVHQGSIPEVMLLTSTGLLGWLWSGPR